MDADICSGQCADACLRARACVCASVYGSVFIPLCGHNEQRLCRPCCSSSGLQAGPGVKLSDLCCPAPWSTTLGIEKPTRLLTNGAPALPTALGWGVSHVSPGILRGSYHVLFTSPTLSVPPSHPEEALEVALVNSTLVFFSLRLNSFHPVD